MSYFDKDKERICTVCGEKIIPHKGVYYVGLWYHLKCFKKWYKGKFPDLEFVDENDPKYKDYY